MEEPKPTEDLSPLAAVASSFPLLVYEDQHGEPLNMIYHQTTLSVADGSMRTFQVPEMRNLRCLETPQGLVLTVDTATLECSLWNPQTGEKIALPAMDAPLPVSCRCLLSDAVSSPDCLVLVYSFEEPKLLFCQVRGGGAWVTQSYDMGLCEIPGMHLAPERRHINNMAAVMGDFYFFESPNEMGVFIFAHSPEPHLELGTFDATMPKFICNEPQVATLSYLLESCHELFLVCLFYPGCTFERLAEVRAYRMDFANQEWCKVTDIGDRAFLLGADNFATSCSATEHGLKKGCVYFAFDFPGDSNDFQIFDLKDDTRELVSPTQDIPPVLTRKPFWMVPVVQ